MTSNYILSYNGVDIPFVTDFSGGKPIMINATKMLQCFPDKKMNNFLRNQETQNYINALSADIGKPISELLVVMKGNSSNFEQGTWMHKNLAIEFARWLNPEFAIWCNRKIKELLTNGTVTLKNNILQLQQNNGQLEQSCKQMEPYANYGYEILESSKMTYSTDEIIKDFSCKISIDEVYAKLVSDGYVGRYKDHDTWFLKAPYGKRNYTKLVSEVIYDKNGQPDHTVNRTKWTEAGRCFLRSVLLDWEVL